MDIQIAIADDHPLIINGLQNMLRNIEGITLKNTYNNGKDLLEGLEKAHFDVLLLDIQMPDKTGIELAKTITKNYPLVRIIALTNLDNNFYIKSMLRNGVAGYLLKNSDQDILIEAIKTVYNGKEFIEPSLREKAWKSNAKSKETATTYSPLTRREKEILSLIVEEMTTQEIAKKLFLSNSTIETHRLNLLLKLDAKNTAGLVKKAIQLGLVE